MQSELQPLVNKKRSLVDEPPASVFLSLSSLSLSFSLHSPSSHLFCFLSFLPEGKSQMTQQLRG